MSLLCDLGFHGGTWERDGPHQERKECPRCPHVATRCTHDYGAFVYPAAGSCVGYFECRLCGRKERDHIHEGNMHNLSRSTPCPRCGENGERGIS
jgi:hypothetical protein